jgi:hypothetical protein
MTLPYKTRRSGPYTLSAGQTGPMPFDYWVPQAADLVVTRYRNGQMTKLGYPGDYTISGIGVSGGGSVTLTSGALAGDRYLLEGSKEPARSANFSAGYSTTPDVLNAEGDRIYVHLQELLREVSRAFKTHDFDATAFDFEGKRLTGVAPALNDGDVVTKGAFTVELAAALDAAEADAAQTAADRIQTGLDRVQTGLDRLQTGVDRGQTTIDKAATAADRAFVSALLSLGITGIYADTTAGLAATADGGFFLVRGASGSDVFATLYRDVAGVATLQGSLPSSVFTERIRDAVSVYYRNIFQRGTMDFGTLNPPRYGNSEVIALTTQTGLIELGFTHAIKQRTSGGSEYALQLSNVPDLRTRRGVLAMIVHSTDAADISSITQVDAIISDGSTIQVTNYVAGGTTKTEIKPNTWLVTSEVIFPNQTNPTTQLWIGTGNDPNSANRLLTGFFCYASDTYQASGPVIMGLKAYWTARMATREGIAAIDLLTDTRRETITLFRSDKILVAGDSYTESLDNLKHKGWVQMASMLSDWHFEGYGVGGDDNLNIWERLIDNQQAYGWAPQNMQPSHILLMSQTNDSLIQQVGYDYWAYDIQRAIQAAQSIAGQVIVATEHPALNDYAHAVQREAARRFGADFIDVTTEASNFYAPDLDFSRGSHPGTRMNSVIWSSVLKYINERMPRPRTGLKIFRKRAGYSVSHIDDLIFDTLPQRAERFDELATGYRGLNDAHRVYYDDLDGVGGTPNSDVVLSAYGRLAGGTTQTADDYLLVEAILPATGGDITSITIAFPCDATAIYAINRMAVPSWDSTRYWAFGVPSGTVTPGDTYQDADGITRTIVGQSGTNVITSPATTGPTQAGTLTKLSGAGPATLAYTSSLPGRDPGYYTAYRSPKGTWTSCLLSNTGGVVTGRINVNPRFYTQGDKIQFLLTKSGTITFGSPTITVDYRKEKVNPKPAPRQRARGVELMPQPLCGEPSELAAWTKVGTVNGVVPEGPLPVGVTKVAELSLANWMYQGFTTPANPRPDPVEIEIEIWARRWLAKFNSAADFSTSLIRPETFDLVPLEIRFGPASGGFATTTLITEMVDLWWRKIVCRVWLVGSVAAPSASRRLYLRPLSGVVQVAKASIREV